MAKQAGAGELRTIIRVEQRTITTDAGYERREWQDLYPQETLRCKWVNAHGIETFEAERLSLGEVATLTMRYRPEITPTCRVYKRGDDRPYEILSVNNVENRSIWLEIKVKRKVVAA